MAPYIIAGVLAGLPLLLVLAFRVHASAFFISIVSGYLLSEYVSDTAGLISSSFVKADGTDVTAKLVVFLLPIVLTIWFMRSTMPGRQLFLHTLPQIANCLMLIVLLLPILPDSVQLAATSNPVGDILNQVSDAVVAVTVTVQLLLMILTSHPARGGKHHKK